MIGGLGAGRFDLLVWLCRAPDGAGLRLGEAEGGGAEGGELLVDGGDQAGDEGARRGPDPDAGPAPRRDLVVPGGCVPGDLRAASSCRRRRL